MSFRTVKVLVGMIGLVSSQEASALEPCHHGVPRISLIEGSSNPPGTLAPDTQALNPDQSLKEQGWHNLRQAQRPLTIVCHYTDKPVSIVLPDTIDTCVFGSRRVNCY
jgi:hypothetical protein